MTEDLLHYPTLIDQAMRGVVKEVLKRVQSNGLPGDHHFYISFSTTHPGVKISEQLKTRYPKEITIVLQHQFWDFKVEEQQFQVTLSFGGVPEKLVVPYVALTAFADPSIKFGLQFQQSEMPEATDVAANTSSVIAPVEAEDEGSAEIISLDSFSQEMMQPAIEQAKLAAKNGEVPIGAVIVQNNKIIAASGNRTIEIADPTAHAEMLVIRSACEILKTERLADCDLYVTLEPCPMCATAISFARIRRLYFGAYDPKGGGVESGPRIFNQPTCHHKPEVIGGISEIECAEILKKFFELRR